MTITDINIAVIGLGYVGLPLLALLSKKYDCWGLDKDPQRIKYIQCLNKKKENKDLDYINCNKLSTSWDDIKQSNVFIITVPTPIDSNFNPDNSSLIDVCKKLGSIISKNSIIIFESTVHPGATEELCIPIIEEISSLKVNKDFWVGYSPERINVNDKFHQLSNTPKIISATDKKALEIMELIYKLIIDAPILKASNVKVAEAAKMYENVQRDVLIALANEFSEYCHSENIHISEVTALASTKWNFAEVYPGLVGGHCIGVDPYYLLHRAKELNVSLPIVNMARCVNESKCEYSSNNICEYIRETISKSKDIRILILGFSYKANCNDIRNTKVFNLIEQLSKSYKNIDCFDPLVDSNLVLKEYNLPIFSNMCEVNFNIYDILIVAVKHKEFENITNNYKNVIFLNDFL